MSLVARINQLIDKNELSYFGIMGATLTAGSCIASVAVIAILMNDGPLWQLAIMCSVAMGSNAAAISHSPLRWVVWMFIINVLCSIFFVMINLF